MKYCWCICFLLFAFLSKGQVKVEKGVSLELANQRVRVLSNVNYDLTLAIPSTKSQELVGSEIICFTLKDKVNLQLDFKESREKLKSISVNNHKTVPIVFENEHIIIDSKYLTISKNCIGIQFIPGNLSLNRNDEYLYTLLVPDRARTLFPCFDQPNLKAKFSLSVSIPKDWSIVGNAPAQDSIELNGLKNFSFKKSYLIPTYLFSFSAGKFTHVTQQPSGRTMHFYHRETDATKIRLSVDSIFQQHATALKFLEDYTQIKYPFQKFDFIAIPDFQYGGMEHVGAIDYKASTLFLDSGATKDQLNARSNLIAHETSHMWFGDLVTMQWFNDVWMKEVFANFMADKITQGSGNNYELKFLITHFPRAYSVDRTLGANPIRQDLTNLQEAGTLYGPIIYDKAPVMMRQLERLMGEEKFRDGLRAYLKKYSFGNATWPDLIKILDERTPADLEAWNKVWVNTPGRPVFNYSLQQKNNRITQLLISQKGEQRNYYLLPQFFEIALVYPDRVEEYSINMNQQQVAVKEIEGKEMPEYILFNSSGQGYGVFPIDALMNKSAIIDLPNSVMRASAYINLYENMLNGQVIKPIELLQLYQTLLTKETEELNLNLIAGQLSNIYWQFISSEQRPSIAPSLENLMWNGSGSASSSNKQKIFFRTYQNIGVTETGLNNLYTLWKHRNPPVGLKLNEDEYTSLALSLAVKSHIDTIILQRQMERITNADRKARLQFLMPAVSPNEATRDSFFASLKDPVIRKKESWVGDALAYLHHPMRQSTSKKYLKESLELLQQVQQTGDIFFPAAWLSSTFGFYQSKEAADVVRNFLKANPNYYPKLKAKILQAADPLFRAEKLVTQ
jgi:aminopeptidase N